MNMARNIFICFSFFLLFSCAHNIETPTFVTKHGLNVHCGTKCFLQEDVEFATDSLLQSFEEHFPSVYTPENIQNVLSAQYRWHSIVILENTYGPIGSCPKPNQPDRQCQGFPCGKLSSTGWCAGSFSRIKQDDGSYQSKTRVVYFDDCISKNALIHELAHLFQFIFENKIDAQHEDKVVWSDIMKAVKGVVKKEVCDG